MKIFNVTQGSEEWLALRAQYDCASEAPAMMGESSKVKRNELLHMKATCTEKEFPQWVKDNLLDKGHAAEKAIKPHIEAMLGEELYPITGADEELGMLASFDGLDMLEVVGFEHKLWNEELAEAVRAGSDTLPDGHHWQLEHQILVGNLQRILFVVSDGTPEKMVHMEYRPVPGRREALLAGWKQFHEDLANYKPAAPDPVVIPAVVKDLPAVSIMVAGSIDLHHNLGAFGGQLRTFIDSINMEPNDDQGFADAEAAVKALATAEERLGAAESNALAQTASIDEMRRTVAQYRDLCKSTRLALEKMVKARKVQIRDELVSNAMADWRDHLNSLNKRLGGNYAMGPMPDYAAAIKGKRTLSSLRNAVDTALANAKIRANQIADGMQVNLQFLQQHAAAHMALFADLRDILCKPEDDFSLLVKSRISEYQAKEQARLEAERERIRQEERAKAEREAREALARQQREEREAHARAERERIQREQQKQNAETGAGAETGPEGTGTAEVKTREPVPAPAAASVLNWKATVSQNSGATLKPNRPTDDQIIDALALHFRVHEMKVVEWLMGMDLEAASKRAATEFV